MSDTPDPLLDAIARISEGQPVDWDALDRLAVTESFRQRLDELKVIAGVADLARKTPSGDGDRAGRLKPAPPEQPVGEGVTWGHLNILEQIGRGAFGEGELGLELPQLLQVRVHPDGDHIAFTAGESKNEIWALENLPPLRRR